jgi:hypothetical protein
LLFTAFQARIIIHFVRGSRRPNHLSMDEITKNGNPQNKFINFSDLRLEAVGNHVIEDLKLLDQLEHELRYETNPIAVTKLKKQIELLHESITKYSEEYLKLWNDSVESNIVATIQSLSQTELLLTQKLISAVEGNEISSQQCMEMLEAVKKRVSALPFKQTCIAKIINNPQFDVKHKLKISLPIIPVFVQYEGEIELAVGSDIRIAWSKLIAKLKGQ